MLKRALVLFFYFACTATTAGNAFAAPYEPRFVVFDGSQWIQSDSGFLGAGGFESEFAYFISYSLDPAYAGQTRYWLDSTPSQFGPVSARFENTGEGVFSVTDLHGGMNISAGTAASYPVDSEGAAQFDPFPYPDFSKPNEQRWILLTGKWAGLDQPPQMYRMYTGVVGVPYAYNAPPVSGASPTLPVGGFGGSVNGGFDLPGAQGSIFTPDPSGTMLNDPNKDFLALGVEVGDMVYNHSVSSVAASASVGIVTEVSALTLTHTPLKLGNVTKSWTAGDLYSVVKPADPLDPQHSRIWRTHQERRMDMRSAFNWKFGNLLGNRTNNFQGRVADLWIDNQERWPEDFIDLATGQLKDPATINRTPLVHFGKATDWNNGSGGQVPGTAANLGSEADWNTTGVILVPGTPVDGALQDPALNGICGDPWVCTNPGSMQFSLGQISLGVDGEIADDRMVLKPNASYEVHIPELSVGNALVSLGGTQAPVSPGTGLVIPFTTGSNPAPVFSITALGNAPVAVRGPIDIIVDSNNDGIFDAVAITLGLDPNDPDGDTDNDGVSDAIEVGADTDNPMDNDADGIIDALEAGADAGDAATASGLKLPNGETATIKTPGTEALSQVSATTAGKGPAGTVFPFGTISYFTTAPAGGSVTVRITFTSNLPKNLVLYKVDNAGTYTQLPNVLWKAIDLNTVDITLTDGDPLTDLDGLVNGIIEDPLAVGIGSAPPPVDGGTTNGPPAGEGTTNPPAGGGGTVGGGGGGGGGGCTPGLSETLDPMWPLLLLTLSGIWLYRRRYAAAGIIAARGCNQPAE